MVATLSAGIVLGLSAGFSPGPLLMLVISQTLRHGPREGIKVACSPLVTDLPIIVISLLVVTGLSGFRPVIGGISLAGAVVVAALARDTIRTTTVHISPDCAAPSSLRRGALVNLLSPHPWLFWFTVGGPLIVRGPSASPAGGIAFIAGFFSCLIGSKIVIALATGKSRRLLDGPTYRWCMRILGGLLLIYATLLARDGLVLLGLTP